MNAADLLTYGFILTAVTVSLWVAGKAHAARMYAADLATARTAARHYRAERDSAQAHLDMIRRTRNWPATVNPALLQAVPPVANQ